MGCLLISEYLLHCIQRAGCCVVLGETGNFFVDIEIGREDRAWLYSVELNRDMSDEDVFTLLKLYKVPEERIDRARRFYNSEPR